MEYYQKRKIFLLREMVYILIKFDKSVRTQNYLSGRLSISMSILATIVNQRAEFDKLPLKCDEKSSKSIENRKK